MPMLEAHIPEGALSPEAEHRLFATLTDLLIRHEGADPNNPAVRQLAWVFLLRPAAVFVAGAPASPPRYKFVTAVPEGQFTRERREAMVKSITDAVLDAEGGAHPRDGRRIWVFTHEVPEGSWGADGRLFGLADIVGLARGDMAAGRAYAEAIFAERRKAGVAG
jgi:phenylpyruvate tautomerase PptA (4-oxalocrotonate tautomerase family)